MSFLPCRQGKCYILTAVLPSQLFPPSILLCSFTFFSKWLCFRKTFSRTPHTLPTVHDCWLEFSFVLWAFTARSAQTTKETTSCMLLALEFHSKWPALARVRPFLTLKQDDIRDGVSDFPWSVSQRVMFVPRPYHILSLLSPGFNVIRRLLRVIFSFLSKKKKNNFRAKYFKKNPNVTKSRYREHFLTVPLICPSL